MQALDVILVVLLGAGNLLGLVIWWRLFVTPVLRLWAWYQRRHKGE